MERTFKTKLANGEDATLDIVVSVFFKPYGSIMNNVFGNSLCEKSSISDFFIITDYQQSNSLAAWLYHLFKPHLYQKH
jgi:hypothetical protein